MKNQSTIHDSNPGLHAEPETLRQQQSRSDEPTMFHYLARGETTSLCGTHMSREEIILPEHRGHGPWVVCPICEFIYSLRGDEQRLRQWITGTYQLGKNRKEHTHE
ncbi:hypothetical protein [Bifidobacterium crudilactis]|jgi:hypothetical protein|uniref:hypothetical protein n=1 Tax=Bifidobacterium crudilactis TaxID=327277 RepID=UPI00235663A6|nr:hypothetical protein [Bifidobacterium crudilactis]MCI1868710.1 hypothetical protein [Bifidobacterium crudilactis]